MNRPIFLFLPLLLIFGILPIHSAFSQTGPDFGLQRTEEVIKLEQNDAVSQLNQIIILPRNGFDSPIDIAISIEPPTKFLQIKINGETSPKIDPKKDPLKLEASIHTDDSVSPGDYKVTVTATSIVNGQKMTRSQSFVIKIIPPNEFSMEVNPSQITILQGGQGSVNVKTVLKKLLSESFELYALMPPGKGLSVSFSGAGEFVHLGHLSGWYLPPKTNESMNTKLQIKASPHTPPGKYTVLAVGKMHDETIEHLSTYKAYTLPIIVTVTKNPEFSHLQNPSLFDITPEFHKMTINSGSIGYNDIQIWSERPDEQITFDVSVVPMGQGVSADINEKRVIPKNPPNMGSFIVIAVSEDAKPGIYKVIVTGKTNALSGKDLEQITEFEIIVPEKRSFKQSSQIPTWIKQNAKWWSDGTITDKDFASAIGFLIKEKIISVDVSTNKDGTILVNDNLQIPDWLRNNAKWWSDGTITDSDFTSGIEYMVKEKIVSFSDQPKPRTESSGKNDVQNVPVLDERAIFGLYTANKWAEYSQTLLLDAINQYNKELKTQIKQDEQEYATTKDKALMDAIIEDKNTIKKNDIDLKNLIGLEEKLRDYESEIRKEASKKRILPADLNKAAEEPINKIEILPPETIGGKLKEAKKALGKLDSIIDGVEYAGGVNPDKLGKDPPIPEDMKNLPGLGDSADELKVLRKGGTYEGDPCSNEKINAYFHWTLADKKENAPKVPMYIILEAWKDGKMLNTLMIQNTSDGEFLMVDHDYDPDMTLDKKTFDSIVKKTKGKVKDIFKSHFITYGDSSEQVFTFKIIKVGPAYSGYVYSGNGDPITIKIPACPKKPEPKQAPQEETERKYEIDSVVDDLSDIVDPFSGHRIMKKPKIVQDVYNTWQTLDEILDKVEKDRENTQSSVISPPEKPQPPVQPNPQTEQTEADPESPVQPNPQTEQTEAGGDTNQIYFVQVFIINGKNHPIYQFVSSPPDSCNDYHFHTSDGKAYAIDGTSLNDPAPSGCGFGKTNSMGFASTGVYKSQIVTWESLTGINIPEDD